MIWFFISCLEPPLPLPPTRQSAAPQSSMLQFGSLTTFRIIRGEPQRILLWQTPTLNAKSKQCARAQSPPNSMVFVIDQTQELHEVNHYMRTLSPSTIPTLTSLSCP